MYGGMEVTGRLWGIISYSSEVIPWKKVRWKIA